MNLYFVQSNGFPYSFVVTVYAQGKGSLELTLFNTSGKNWSLALEDTREWAQSIKASLARIIEHRLRLMV